MRRDLDPTTGAASGGVNPLRAVANFVAGISSAPPLPEYALHYYDSLRAKFETLPEPPDTDPAARKAYADARTVTLKHRDALMWSDLMLLDLSIVRCLGFDALRLKIADLRSRLDGTFAPLPDGLLPKLEAAKPADMEALRAEAEVLATRVWHARMARNARDRYVGELRGTLLRGVIVILAAFLAVSWFIWYVPLYFVIVTAGMLGALTSFLRRLQAVLGSPPHPDQSSDLSALAYEKRAAVLSLVVGGVFAIVVYMLFAAGLGQVSGELGPKFTELTKPPATGVDFVRFVLEVGPLKGADYAKVVVWSFIAGFFEQLVPDALDRVVKKK